MAGKEHLPIDRGWAWVIVIVTSTLWAFQAGGFKCQGVILVELQERFPDASESSILWVFSLSSIICCASGLLNGWLITVTSHRTTAMIGICCTALGFIGIAYATQLWMVYCAFGLFYGLGSGMIGLSALLATGPYFERRKAMAIGLTGAGSGVGAIGLPNLLRVLFDNFDFSGALLLYAGCSLHLLILVTLLRPMSYYEAASAHKLRKAEQQEYEEQVKQHPPPKLIMTNYEKEDELHIVFSPSHVRLLNDTNKTEQTVANKSSETRERSATHTGHKHRKRTQSLSHMFSSLPGIDSLRNDKKSRPLTKASSRLLSLGNISMTVPIVPESNEQGTKRFDWRIMLAPKTVMLGISMLFYQAGAGLVYQCLAPLGKSRGVEKNVVALVLTVGGIVEIPCRIFNGWLADKKLFSTLTQFTLYMAIVATAALICAIVSKLPGMLVMIIGMSTVGTSIYNILPIVCADLVGERNVTTALSVQWFYQAVAFAATTPIAGKLYEVTVEWETLFYYISSVMFVAFFINLPYSIYWNCCIKKTHEKTTTSN